MEKLIPCPFCDEKEDIRVIERRHHGSPIEVNGQKYWRVECLPCDARTGDCFDGDAALFGYKTGREMAIAAWTRRAK